MLFFSGETKLLQKYKCKSSKCHRKSPSNTILDNANI